MCLQRIALRDLKSTDYKIQKHQHDLKKKKKKKPTIPTDLGRVLLTTLLTQSQYYKLYKSTAKGLRTLARIYPTTFKVKTSHQF